MNWFFLCECAKISTNEVICIYCFVSIQITYNIMRCHTTINLMLTHPLRMWRRLSLIKATGQHCHHYGKIKDRYVLVFFSLLLYEFRPLLRLSARVLVRENLYQHYSTACVRKKNLNTMSSSRTTSLFSVFHTIPLGIYNCYQNNYCFYAFSPWRWGLI